MNPILLINSVIISGILIPFTYFCVKHVYKQHLRAMDFELDIYKDRLIALHKDHKNSWEETTSLLNKINSVERKFSLDHVAIQKINKEIEDIKEKLNSLELTLKIVYKEEKK